MQTSMKKYILFPVVLVALVLSSNMVKAQAEDVSNPLLQYINKDKGIRFTAGAVCLLMWLIIIRSTRR